VSRCLPSRAVFGAALASWCTIALLPLVAQDPAPSGEGPGVGGALLAAGDALLQAEDPVLAWSAFRAAMRDGAPPAPCHLGLGRAHLMLGESAFALAHAEAALRVVAGNEDGMALCIRALIRARRFDEAVARAGVFTARVDAPGSGLLAARASALFRVQRIDDAASGYRRVVARDPLHAEANLRLGSGLLPPGPAPVGDELRAAVAAMARGDREGAIEHLRQALATAPGHAVAHRLLGEVLFARQAASCMAAGDPAFAALVAAMPPTEVRGLPVAQFVPGYERLSAPRRAVVDRTAAMFGRHLGKLVAIGGRHDLLQELERTTDAEERGNLRGRRTFDGRVWDDVRGVGGVHAATGIEALDDSAMFGFDTLAHEVAHQVHFYALSRVQRARIRSLWQQAVAAGRCLDYYAATNDAEYFGQGVEAFASLAKRPGGETTHGHTRWELWRVDRDLHDFIAEVVDYDPLATGERRTQVLVAAIAAALRVGRTADAVVAAGMLAPGDERERWLAESMRADAAARCH
jgi:hypothetical protein